MRLAILSLLFLAACMPEPETAAKADAGDTTACGADTLQDLVGQPVNSFDFQALGHPLRVMLPDAMMTMDHRPERLNVEHEEKGTITRIWCG